MANEFIARKGLISSGSVNVSGSVTASFFKGDGSQLTNLPAAAVLSSSVSIDTYTFNGDGSTKNYILSQSYDVSSLFVSVEGLSQTNIQDYTLTGATLSFVSAPPVSSNILVKALLNVTQNMTGSFSGSFFGILASASYAATASYAANADLLDGLNSTVFATTGSNTFVGNQIVSGSSTVSNTGNFQVNITGTTPTAYTQLYFNGTGRAYGIGVGNASETTYGIANEFFLFDHGAAAVRLAVDTSGRVGIGTSAPAAQLQVQGNVSASSFTGSLAYSSLTGVPGGLVSSSAQYPGWVTSSAQINTGSFTGSFTGSAKFNAAPIILVVDNHAFVGNGVTTNYTLSSSYDPAVLTVSVEGLLQTQTTDYTLSGTTLSFVATPPTSSNIFVKAFRLALV